MNKNIHLYQSKEIYFLTVLMLTEGICTNMPLVFTRTAGTGAPLSALLTGLFTVILILLFSKKFSFPKNINIINETETHFGVAGKFLFSLILLAYLFISTAYISEQFSVFAQKLAFPTSPLWFIALFFFFAALLGALVGIPGLMRLSKFLVPLFVAIWALMIISVLWHCNFTNLFPFLGNGVPTVLRGSLSGLLIYSDIILLFLIAPASHSSTATYKALLWGAITAAFINIVTLLTFTAKIPYPLSVQEQHPLYLLSKEVYYGRFFQRIDAILLLVSSLYNMLTLSFHLLLISAIIEKSFNITPRYISLVAPAFIIFFSITGATILSPQALEGILSVFSIGLIFLMLLISFFIGRRKNKNET